MITVAQDGSGDYRTLQAAIDAAPETGAETTEIRLGPGVWRERAVIHRSNLRLVGQDAENTVITASGCAKDPYPDGREKGTFLSATLLVTGDDVRLHNLTVRNDAGDGRRVGQAVALYAAGTRFVCRDCRLIAHQDTLFCGPLMPKVVDEITPRQGCAPVTPNAAECPSFDGRQLYENCYIEGDVDFIFGSYRCWFENCTLFMGERGGWYTAANTPEDQRWGLVFSHCRLTGACGEGAGFLGRPWRRFARTLFLRCEMDAHVSPRGVADWDEERLVTERCGEWATRGDRADQTTRHPRQKRLTDTEAASCTREAVLGGWIPPESLSFKQY